MYKCTELRADLLGFIVLLQCRYRVNQESIIIIIMRVVHFVRICSDEIVAWYDNFMYVQNVIFIVGSTLKASSQAKI